MLQIHNKTLSSASLLHVQAIQHIVELLQGKVQEPLGMVQEMLEILQEIFEMVQGTLAMQRRWERHCNSRRWRRRKGNSLETLQNVLQKTME